MFTTAFAEMNCTKIGTASTLSTDFLKNILKTGVVFL